MNKDNIYLVVVTTDFKIKTLKWFYLLLNTVLGGFWPAGLIQVNPCVMPYGRTATLIFPSRQTLCSLNSFKSPRGPKQMFNRIYEESHFLEVIIKEASLSPLSWRRRVVVSSWTRCFLISLECFCVSLSVYTLLLSLCSARHAFHNDGFCSGVIGTFQLFLSIHTTACEQRRSTLNPPNPAK